VWESNVVKMTRAPFKPLLHLELHTHDLAGASSFYAELCGWRPERVGTVHSSYVALDLAPGVGGGIVDCPIKRPLWLPYVEVADIGEATDHARVLGASVLLEPREGPSGWRSVVSTAAGGEIAFWEGKG
jgi:predicted enzyme related to lactoylglutathione lyase